MRPACVASLLVAVLCSACAEPRPNIDLVAPRVISVNPEDGAIKVPLDGSVRICFDKPMKPESLSTASLFLSREIGHQARATEVTVNVEPDARCADLAPLGSYSPSTVYRVEVARSVLSATGSLEISGASRCDDIALLFQCE